MHYNCETDVVIDWTYQQSHTITVRQTILVGDQLTIWKKRKLKINFTNLSKFVHHRMPPCSAISATSDTLSIALLLLLSRWDDELTQQRKMLVADQWKSDWKAEYHLQAVGQPGTLTSDESAGHQPKTAD